MRVQCLYDLSASCDDDIYFSQYEVPKGVIRVKVENHSMTSMAVQLDAKTTAGDVIAKFEKQCERAKQMSPDSE